MATGFIFIRTVITLFSTFTPYSIAKERFVTFIL